MFPKKWYERQIKSTSQDKLGALEGHNSFNLEGSGYQTDDVEREITC